jgi:predicted nucleic-acid-binding Zn-ribbon protein
MRKFKKEVVKCVRCGYKGLKDTELIECETLSKWDLYHNKYLCVECHQETNFKFLE